MSKNRGRVLALDITPNTNAKKVKLQSEFGINSFLFTSGSAKIGDIVEITPEAHLQVLTKAKAAPVKWPPKILNPRRLKALKVRAQVESVIREFFTQQNFWETRTPLLVPCAGMEPHIRPFQAQGFARDSSHQSFLPTSPEFAMKRLLVGGLEKIFQISPAFRDEPRSLTHLPEFTILEWYRAYSNYEAIMEDTEKLFEKIAYKISGSTKITYGGRSLDFSTPWPRLTVRDLFKEHVNIDLNENTDLKKECLRLGLGVSGQETWPDTWPYTWPYTWDDLYFKIWLNLIEPKLPADRPVLVTRYPASQAALAVIDQDPDGSRWARRFEVYAGGLELGNAFEELTEPDEQLLRFQKDMKLRSEIYGPNFPPSPIDLEFIEALREGMPPSGGIAVGVDRLVMLFADETDVSYTVWLDG